MGNCQAIDAAALVIQHPDGRLHRMYWPVPASEVMRANPGHYVSVIIPLQAEADGGEEGDKEGRKKKPKTVRFTHVKLLRSTDTLALGHAYRLVTSQEVMKVLRAKKNGRTKQQQQQQQRPQQQQDEVVVVPGQGKTCQNRETGEVSDKENSDNHNQEGMKQHQIQGQGMQQAAGMGSGRRSKSWRPSLQSIDEGVS